MEGVGARLGRSSTRYSGPAVVFSGPVRKWKKKWVPIQSPNNNANGNHHQSAANNGGNSSHLLLYKWTPVNGGGSSTPAAKDAEDAAGEKNTRRRFRYVPVSITEEQKQENVVKSDADSKDGNEDETTNDDSPDTKADIDDTPMQDLKDSDQEGAVSQEDASGTHLDLNLGLKSHDGKHENGMNQDGETGHRGKRKVPDLEMRM